MLWSLPQIWPYYKAYIFPYWSSVLLPMVQITLMSSVYTTIIMSWERYVRICMVSKVETICFPSGVLAYQCTEVRFASLLSGEFITAIVVNLPERKLEKCTSVQWCNNQCVVPAPGGIISCTKMWENNAVR